MKRLHTLIVIFLLNRKFDKIIKRVVVKSGMTQEAILKKRVSLKDKRNREAKNILLIECYRASLPIEFVAKKFNISTSYAKIMTKEAMTQAYIAETREHIFTSRKKKK